MSTNSYFIFRITMRCMVETQYDAAGCLSTASLLHTSYFILHTSYFILHTLYFILRCMVETQYDAASCLSTASPLRLYFILHTSYFILHTALHGGDAVRCSKLPLHCLSTLYFILHTSYFLLRCMVETTLYFTSYFLLRKKHPHKSSKPTDYLIRFLRNNCY